MSRGGGGEEGEGEVETVCEVWKVRDMGERRERKTPAGSGRQEEEEELKGLRCDLFERRGYNNLKNLKAGS